MATQSSCVLDATSLKKKKDSAHTLELWLGGEMAPAGAPYFMVSLGAPECSESSFGVRLIPFRAPLKNHNAIIAPSGKLFEETYGSHLPNYA